MISKKRNQIRIRSPSTSPPTKKLTERVTLTFKSNTPNLLTAFQIGLMDLLKRLLSKGLSEQNLPALLRITLTLEAMRKLIPMESPNLTWGENLIRIIAALSRANLL